MVQRTSASSGEGSPDVTGFYDDETGSIQYVATCPATRKTALIDIVLDYDTKAARTSTGSAEAVLRYVEAQGLEVEWILDTHPHADHFSAAHWLQQRLDAPTGIGEKVREIAGLWTELYHQLIDPEGAFDRLFADGDTFRIGALPVRVMLSPGHTLGSVTYVVGGDAAFVHDTFMQPDAGTSRCDFPGGSARELWSSMQAILALPDQTRLFVGHDYCPPGRPDPAWEATVAEQRNNKHLAGGVSEADYIRIREERDATLPLPNRMLAALQVNLRGGRLPKPEADGNSYLKIPLNRF